MFAIVIFAAIFAVIAFLVLARYSTSPTVRAAEIEARRRRPDPRPRMTADAVRRLVIDLLGAMRIEAIEEQALGGGRYRLRALRHDPLRDSPFVVFIEGAPEGEVVEQHTVVELADAVRGEPGAVGLLITPYEILREGLAGLGTPIELIDGVRLRALSEEHLPDRLETIDRHQGFGARHVATDEEPRLSFS